MKYSQKDIMANDLAIKINDFSQNIRHIPATAFPLEIDVLSRQLVDSINRVKYFQLIQSRPIDVKRTDPNNFLFDPLRSIIYLKNRNLDEAFWLAFLTIHFGENYHSKWKLTKNFYNNLGQTPQLTWANVSSDPTLIDNWVSRYYSSGIKLKFGNHRKYESFSQLKLVIDSYIQLVNNSGGHQQLFKPKPNEQPKEQFKRLFKELKFYRFARLGLFDYLSLIYKTQLAPIQADSCHIKGSTGPKNGAKRLFGQQTNGKLDQLSIQLADHLGIGYQEFEDAICNWQKSPDKYSPYTG
ncbi:TPA: hypothetical protein JIR21_09770 [Acinetobacter baumannii]|nr:hypothetical protein [Acinetobacter baumannii]